jgi:hypothetical protein
MKLARFSPIGRERPGVVTDGEERLDLSGYFQDWNAAFFANEGFERVN